MNKKIGIVANAAFNIYNFRLGLMHFLKSKGYEVIAIAPDDGFAGKITGAGFTFIPLKNLARKGTNPFGDMMLMNELRKIYSEEKFDAVLQYTIKPNIYGTLAAKLTGTKSICTVTGLGYTFLNDSIASVVAQNLYRAAFSFAGTVLFQNEDDRKVFIQKKLVDKNRTAIVPGSGIDTKKFHPGFCGKKKQDGITRFLMIGRFLKDKGIYEYIEAARLLREKNLPAEFHLAGEVDKDNPSSITDTELKQWIDQKIIIHHGYLPDTRTAICVADCIVLPSYREGMPRVILEAMAMGRPCITTDVAGCRDAIDATCGFLTNPQDPVSLSEQMKRFFDQSQTSREKMQLAARQRAERIFAEEIIFDQYLGILQKS